jgi:Questin oxidase-like
MTVNNLICPSAVQLVDRLLDDRSYDIEFNGHLTNHAKHAVIALAGLGASPQRIEEFYATYPEETPYGHLLRPPRPATVTITDDNWREFWGARKHFTAYCAFFDQKERELGLQEVLRTYVPPLLDGWLGGFAHGTIHLGWALAAGSRWMIIEGLAYSAYSYRSCHPERSHHASCSGAGAVDSLLTTVRGWNGEYDDFVAHINDVITDTTARAMHGIDPELARSGLQFRVARLLADGHPSFYEIPAWIDEHDIGACWKQMYYIVTLSYLVVPGDIVLLHLITSLFALERIAEWLPIEQQRYILRCFWIGMFGLLLHDGNPPDLTTLETLHAAYCNTIDAPGAADPDWNALVARAMEEKEEHNPKLVYVLRALWRRTGGKDIYRVAAHYFTETPDYPSHFDAPPAE